MTRYAPIYGTVNSIIPLSSTNSQTSCMQLISMMSQTMGQINLVVSPQTYVLEQHTFEVGDSIIAIYDTQAPVPLIYPPQFQAIILAENGDGDLAAFDYFDEDLLNTDQTLKLNLPENNETEILLSNGQTFFYNPGGHFLFVLYQASTRSIPAMTTPETIIVFCSPEENESE